MSSSYLRHFFGRCSYSVLTHPISVRILTPILSLIFGNRIPQLRSGLKIIEIDRSVSPDVRCRIFWGFYEISELRLIRKHVRGDIDIVELGSSLGVVACSLAEKLQESRKLVCVEANPNLIYLLKKNVRLCNPRITPIFVHAAISGRITSGSVDFSINDDSRSSKVVAADSSLLNSVTIPAMSLNELLRNLDIGEYCLVADIEGAEADILEFEAEALKNCRQLVIELHDTDRDGGSISVDDMLRMITDRHGLTCMDQATNNVFYFERLVG